MGQNWIYIINRWCSSVCPQTCSTVWSAVESVWESLLEFCKNENVYQNYCCVDITNNYYFQVVFEVAFNSAKGGYVALDDISFSPVFCSNQTGKSSFCCLISFFSSLLCFLELPVSVFPVFGSVVRMLLSYLASACWASLPLLTRQHCKADKENTIVLWIIWKPIFTASPLVTLPLSSATAMLDWMLRDVLGFPQLFLYKEAKVLDFSLLLMQGISSSIHMPWDVLQSQSRSYVFLSMLFQKVLFPTRSGTSVRILLDFHSSRSQISPHDLCSLGIWDQGLCHLWVQPLNSLYSCLSLLLLSNCQN